MTSPQSGVYGDLLYRGNELVIVRSLGGSVACQDWTADVAEYGHLMFLNAVLDPTTQQIYASGKANIGSAVVIVGPNNFKTVIPGGYGNYPSQLTIVNGQVACYVVLSLTEYGLYDLAGNLLQTWSIPAPYPGTSQGIRFIGDDGAVFWGDQTMAGIFEGLVIREWMQRSGYTGGQGQDGGFALSGNGIATIYPSGNTFFPRIAVSGSTLALLYVNAGLVFWDTLTLPLHPAPPVPSTPKPPKITVLEWTPSIEAGVRWPVKFKDEGSGTTYTVEKDAQDRLQIGAVGLTDPPDHTGTTRQLHVVCPECPPCPEYLPMLKRFWCQFNIGSLDEAQTPDHLDGVDVACIPVQQVHADVTTDQLGPNIYPNLVAAGFFKSLADKGIPLVIEMGSVKDGDCQAVNNINGMQWAVQRVADAGGAVAGFSADEPLTNSRSCHQSIEVTAQGHANWTHAIRALGPMQVIWLEGWPDYTTLADIQKFLSLLRGLDALPDAFHVDIYHEHSTDAKTKAFILGCQQECDRYGITFGVFVNSTKDPIATDAQHDLNLKNLALKLYAMHPTVAQVHVAAWAHRVSPDPTHKTQNVPNNLGTNGLLETFAAVRTIFKDVPLPEPTPPEGDDMLYVKLIEDREPLAVKEIKDVGDGDSVLVLPDFDDPTIDPATNKPRGLQHNAVFSMQPVGPTGADGYRKEGTAGAYEKCKVDGSTGTFRPEPNLRLARIFFRVGGA